MKLIDLNSWLRFVIFISITSITFSSLAQEKSKREKQNYIAQKIIESFPEGTENINYGGTDFFHPRRTTGDQYLISEDFKPCKVFTNANEIDCDECRYDIMEDMLDIFIDEEYVSSMVSLAKTNISAFEMSGRRFVQFANSYYDSSAVAFNIKEGFYEEIYQGKISVYISWKKIFQNNNNTFKNSIFLESRKIFAYVEGQKEFVRLNSKKSITKLMPEKKKEIKQIIRNYELKLNSATPGTLKLFFNELNQL